MRAPRAFVLLVLLPVVLSGTARAQTTWFVDDESCPNAGTGTLGDPFCDLQHALDQASSGDTILVLPGAYGALDYRGKNVRVKSLEGPTSTTLGPVTFKSSEGRNAVLDGFRVLRGSGVRMLDCDGASPTIRNNNFENASSGIGGTAMSMTQGASPLVFANVIRNNVLFPPGSIGGAVQILDASPVIDSNLIDGNSSFAASSGAVGGAFFVVRSDVLFRNNLFIRNRCVDEARNEGGAVYAQDSTIRVFGNTFTANLALDGQDIITGGVVPGQGGAIYLRNCMTQVADTVFWGDSASLGQEVYLEGGALQIRTSDLDGGLPGIGGSGSVVSGAGLLETDPLFLGMDAHLSAGSPLIDQGSPTPQDAIGVTDGDLDPRILDGDGSGNARLDMGWDEFNPTTLTVTGSGAIGSSIVLTTQAVPGQAYVLFGALDAGSRFLPPFGSILIQLPTASKLGAGIVPGTDTLPIPSSTALIGTTLYVQALAFDSSMRLGSFSRRVSITVF